MSARTVLGFGELLWDRFPEGRRLGGAPANLAYHALALGERAGLLSRVGTDEEGDAAVAELAERGVRTDLIQRDEGRPTGSARVEVRGGEVDFLIDDSAAWTAPSWSETWDREVARASALGFGSLIASTETGRRALERAATTGRHALRLVDLNLRPPLTTEVAIDAALACANAIKVSEEEEAILRQRVGTQDLGAWALARGYRALAITRGVRGCTLVTERGRADQPGLALDTRGGDPVGAGDAFSAALLYHLLRKSDPEPASRAANRYAAFVASRSGAMPPIPPEIRDEVTASGDGAGGP